MSDAAEPDTSAWLAKYAAEIESLLRAIELGDGFVLHPIELPGPDEVRALAARVEAAGHPVIVIEPPTADAFRDLVGSLFSVTPPKGGVVLALGRVLESWSGQVLFDVHPLL